MTVVVVAPQQVDPSLGAGIFLAGGISDVHDWQSDAATHLGSVWPVVLNPRRPDFPMSDPVEGERQIRWEFEQLGRAAAILFWFSFETIQPITLYELGRWAHSPKPLAIGTHPRYARRFDVVQQLRLARPGLTVHTELTATCAAARALAPRLP